MALWELSPHRGGNDCRGGSALALHPTNAGRRGDEGGSVASGALERNVPGEQAEAAQGGRAGGAAAEGAAERGAQSASRQG